MVKAAMSNTGTTNGSTQPLSFTSSREDTSTSTSNMQLVLSNMHQDNLFEEMKRQYNVQNRLLAQQNEELHMKVTNLERRLFQTQKEVLTLKNEKIQLMDKLKLNSKRFNDLIIDGFENLLNEYRSCMADVGIDVAKREIPLKLLTRVSQGEEVESRKFCAENYEFDHYWKNVNDDLQRRKSILSIPNRGSEHHHYDNPLTSFNEDQLDTLVENAQGEEEAEKPKPLEPEYEDAQSVHVPMKRQSLVMEKIEGLPLTEVPFLGLAPVEEKRDRHEEGGEGDGGYDAFSSEMMEPLQVNEAAVEVPPAKTKRTTTKVSRELKNLDTEKTRRLLGIDALDDDDVEESTSERRKSRRRSLVVNYQIPSFKEAPLVHVHSNKRRRKTGRRASGRFQNRIFVDEDKENVKVSGKTLSGKGNGENVLRNITNIKNDALGLQGTGKKANDGGESIFDLENLDMFGEYDRGLSMKRRESSAYDMVL